MGVKLFRRHGPTLTTTDRAKALGQRVEQALSLMRTAVDDCRRVKQPLRVTCAPTFASRWLVPRLATYHTIPGADAIVLDNSQAVLPTGSFDVAIRSGVGPWPGYSSAKLMGEQRTPMFSPKWAPRRLTAKKLLAAPFDTRSRVVRVVQACRHPECKTYIRCNPLFQLRTRGPSGRAGHRCRPTLAHAVCGPHRSGRSDCPVLVDARRAERLLVALDRRVARVSFCQMGKSAVRRWDRAGYAVTKCCNVRL